MLLLCIGACVCAFLFGLVECFVLNRHFIKKKRQQLYLKACGIQSKSQSFTCSVQGIDARVLHGAMDLHHRLQSGQTQALSAGLFQRVPRLAEWFYVRKARAGEASALSEESCVECCFRLSLAGLAIGMLFGMILSSLLSFILAIVGFVVCATALPRALKHEEKQRAIAIERDLPEMLEVLALGLRSGLTFESSLTLYCSHFQTVASAACKSAQHSWELGLLSREEALRRLANSFDSLLFTRTIESVLRSLKFGTSLVENLTEIATEARNAYRTQREEAIAKAPVKMMLPTSALILPAMLLLVLGPVLLEIAGAF